MRASPAVLPSLAFGLALVATPACAVSYDPPKGRANLPDGELLIIHSEREDQSFEVPFVRGLVSQLCDLDYAVEPERARPRAEAQTPSCPANEPQPDPALKTLLHCEAQASTSSGRLSIALRRANMAPEASNDEVGVAEICSTDGRITNIAGRDVIALGYQARKRLNQLTLSPWLIPEKTHPRTLITHADPATPSLDRWPTLVEVRAGGYDDGWWYRAPLENLSKWRPTVHVVVAIDETAQGAAGAEVARQTLYACSASYEDQKGPTPHCVLHTVRTVDELWQTLTELEDELTVAAEQTRSASPMVLYPADLRALIGQPEAPELAALERDVATRSPIPVIGRDPAQLSRGFAYVRGVSPVSLGEWAALAYDGERRANASGNSDERPDLFMTREVVEAACPARLGEQPTQLFPCNQEEPGDSRCPIVRCD